MELKMLQGFFLILLSQLLISLLLSKFPTISMYRPENRLLYGLGIFQISERALFTEDGTWRTISNRKTRFPVLLVPLYYKALLLRWEIHFVSAFQVLTWYTQYICLEQSLGMVLTFLDFVLILVTTYFHIILGWLSVLLHQLFLTIRSFHARSTLSVFEIHFVQKLFCPQITTYLKLQALASPPNTFSEAALAAFLCPVIFAFAKAASIYQPTRILCTPSPVE